MKRPDGITLLALWHLFLGLSTLFAMLVLLGVGGVLGWVACLEEPAWFGALQAGFFGVIAAFLFVLSAGFLVLAVGLWNLRPWARIPALVVAAVSLVKFPVGTIIGGFTLWYLLRDEGGGLVLRDGPPRSQPGVAGS